MIKVLSNKNEKDFYKKSIKDLFLQEYRKSLTDEIWDFLNGYTDKSVMIVYVNGNNVVGLANLIHNFHTLNQFSFEYLIFTTSVVSKEFRSKGVYTLLMFEVREYLESSNCEFVMAYPNELALPIITSPFYRFNVVSNFSLRLVNDFHGMNSCDIMNFTKLSKSFTEWRFLKCDYYLLKHFDKVLICKDFNENIDVIEIFKQNDFDLELFSLPLKSIPDNPTFILPSFRMKDPSKGESIHEQQIVLCCRKNSMNFESNLDFSNLCWDIM